ncbi:MAG: ATP-binding protein [Bacteroidetes bacterium]|nr:ATP-binding protein [Bacteroidota bacterium]
MLPLIDKRVCIKSLTPDSTVENTVVGICEELHIGEEKFGNILLAVTEAVDNAITHGNQNNPQKEVQLLCRNSEKELTFSVIDEGTHGFDIEQVTDPTKPENPSESGRGILLMKMLCDKVEFINDQKTVLLSFNLN